MNSDPKITGTYVFDNGEISHVVIDIVDRGLVFEIKINVGDVRCSIKHIIENVFDLHDRGVCWMDIKTFYEL